MTAAPTLAAIREAHARIAPYIHRTPVMTSTLVNRLAGASLFFKCENFQKVGAFKARGACNAVFSLSDEEARNGVVTHSSGNHAAALSMAAGKRGIPAHIVMPDNAPRAKVSAVKSYGGRIVFCAATLQAREETAARIMAETGACLIHPYNDYRVMAGQGTAALELLEDFPDLDMVMTPVGGGGLLSGTAIAVKGINPKIQVIGAEPAGADDAYRSFKSGTLVPMENPRTVADGLRTSLGEKGFPIIRSHVDDIVTASEEAIIDAMRKTWEFMKSIIEPSSSVPLAALMEGKLEVEGRRIGIVLSGGNVDLDRLPWQE